MPKAALIHFDPGDRVNNNSKAKTLLLDSLRKLFFQVKKGESVKIFDDIDLTNEFSKNVKEFTKLNTGKN